MNEDSYVYFLGNPPIEGKKFLFPYPLYQGRTGLRKQAAGELAFPLKDLPRCVPFASSKAHLTNKKSIFVSSTNILCVCVCICMYLVEGILDNVTLGALIIL